MPNEAAAKINPRIIFRLRDDDFTDGSSLIFSFITSAFVQIAMASRRNSTHDYAAKSGI